MKHLKHTFILIHILSLTNGEDACEKGMGCVPLLECSQLNDLSLKILNQDNRLKRGQLLGVIRDKLCWPQLSRQLFVCCPIGQVQDYEETTTSVPEMDRTYGEGLYLGSFNQMTFHPVRGDLLVKDKNTFRIRNFVYDGEGPDVFFIVGLRSQNAIGKPNRHDAVPVPYPAVNGLQRSIQQFEDPNIPILGKFSEETVDLALPVGVSVSDVKWISLFCRYYDIDFGHVKIRPRKFLPKRT